MRCNSNKLTAQQAGRAGWMTRPCKGKGAACRACSVAVTGGKCHGFTLIEALIAIVLVGVAIAALMVSNQSFTSANGAGLELSTAEFLIEQVRETTVNEKTFANLPNFSTNGNFVAVSGYPNYSRKTKVEYVNASDLCTVPTSGTTPFYRITVEVRLNNETLSSASWLRANY